MFDPRSHSDLFEKARKKKYGIVFITDTDTTVSFTSSRNPYRRALTLIPNRGFSDEVYIVLISSLEVIAEIPPLIPRC